MNKEWFKASVDAEDRFKFPYQVLDTDYKEYLVMYRCRDEYRKVTERDDLNPVQEDYRSMIEAYDEAVHPEALANRTIAAMGPNEGFKNLTDMIKSIPTERVGDEQLGAELDLFGKTVPDPMGAFPTGQPSLEVWKTRRDFYAAGMDMPTEEESLAEGAKEDELPEDPQWMHDMRVSVFMRKPYDVKDTKYRDFAVKMKERMPSLNWDEIMQYVEHKDDNCVRGDIFKHESAKRFDDIHLFDRGEDKQT
jgi:hypothetical protein